MKSVVKMAVSLTTAVIVGCACAAGFPQTSKGLTSTAAAAAPAGIWRSAVGNLAGIQWGEWGIHYATSVPGSSDILAGVSGVGLYSSSNGGVTWTLLSSPGQIKGRLEQVTFDPSDPTKFWATTIHGGDIYKTRDGGRTFEAIKPGGGDTISVDFTDPDRRTLLAAGHENFNSLQISVTSGRSWHSLAENFPPGVGFITNGFLYGENTIIACSTSRSRPGIFRSTDAGRSWICVAPYTTGWQRIVVGRKPGQLYWSGISGGFIRSDDGGKTWKNLGGPIAAPPIELPDRTLVSYSATRLLRSSDDGMTWRPFGPAFPYTPKAMFYNERLRTYFIYHTTNKTDRNALLGWRP